MSHTEDRFLQHRAYTTADKWAGVRQQRKVERYNLVLFVLIKLGSGGVGGGEAVCQSHRQHNECSIKPLPKGKTHVRRRLALLQVPSAPSKSWWIYISPWGFAPAGDSVNVQSTCSSTLTDPPVRFQLGENSEHPTLSLFLDWKKGW